MKDVIAQEIANKEGFILTGTPELIIGNQEYQCIWDVKEEETSSFTIYSNGEYDYINYDTGQEISGRSLSPHNRKWTSILMRRGYAGEYAYAACFAWRAIKDNF